MNILIDTHIFLWAVVHPEKLRVQQRELLLDSRHTIYVSSISIAEMSIKASIGKLNLFYNPVEVVKENDFKPLAFTEDDALLLQDLPLHHKDPFDRMLVVQALQNDFYVMSNDGYFELYVSEGLKILG
jgi:PIN domain nuclease of toxin-antitoxin system